MIGVQFIVEAAFVPLASIHLQAWCNERNPSFTIHLFCIKSALISVEILCVTLGVIRFC